MSKYFCHRCNAHYKPINLKDPEAWSKWLRLNWNDGYGMVAMDAAGHVMEKLDQGKTPKEAEDEGFEGKDLTGFLAGEVAGMVSHCHERGEEFKEYWNKRMGGDPKAKGVVNPALWTMKAK